VATLVVGLILTVGPLTIVVLVIVQSVRIGSASWYDYPILVLVLTVWLAFVGHALTLGVYVRESGVVVVNLLWHRFAGMRSNAFRWMTTRACDTSH
jgi:hypothetical protein